MDSSPADIIATPRASDSTPENDRSIEDASPLLDPLARMQNQLDEARRALEEGQKLATVGTIAAVIAHEFNNLLTPIASYCQMGLRSIDAGKLDDPIIRKALDKGLKHAQRAGKISGALLNLVRGHADESAVSVQTLVEETLSVLARDPQRDGIALRVQVKPDLQIKGDAIQLEQVLLNLLINARQALIGDGTGRGGSITIRADRSNHDQDRIRISIADTGPGIAPENLERIFDPFFTTKNAGKPGEPKGTGLGLHICRQIIDRHGGDIRVESTPPRGTTFNILLPAA